MRVGLGLLLVASLILQASACSEPGRGPQKGLGCLGPMSAGLRSWAKKSRSSTLRGRLWLAQGQVLDPSAAKDEVLPAQCAAWQPYPRPSSRGTLEGVALALQPIVDDSEAKTQGAAAKEGEPEASAERRGTTHRLRLEACGLSPALIVARRGDWLEIHNASGKDRSLRVGRSSPWLAQGGVSYHPLEEGGQVEIRCAHVFCGRSDVVVFYPEAQITSSDAKGEFAFTGLDPARSYWLHVWHPRLQNQRRRIAFEAGRSAWVDLVLSRAENARSKRD